MCGDTKKIESKNSCAINTEDLKNVRTKCGRNYTCEWDSKKIAGIIALVGSAVILIFALLLASGTFGIGYNAFVAGGLTIGSMLGFGVSAYLLLPKFFKKNHVVI